MSAFLLSHIIFSRGMCLGGDFPPHLQDIALLGDELAGVCGAPPSSPEAEPWPSARRTGLSRSIENGRAYKPSFREKLLKNSVTAEMVGFMRLFRPTPPMSPVTWRPPSHHLTPTDRNKAVRKHVDWYTNRSHPSAHDQKSCGCCYAASTASLIDELYAIHFNVIINVSVGELFECHYDNPHKQGCEGGNPISVLHYIKEKGVGLSAEYPYFPLDLGCKAARISRNRKYFITRYLEFEPGMDPLFKALEWGPLIVMLNGENEYRHYYEGIFDASKCTGEPMHFMLLVSYDIRNPSQAALVLKNSWGKSWGIEGHLHLAFVYSPHDKEGPCKIGVATSFTAMVKEGTERSNRHPQMKRHSSRRRW